MSLSSSTSTSLLTIKNNEINKRNDIFERFKVVEFPITYVGLTSTLELDVEENLKDAAYLLTMCGNRLMKFENAREISAPHRAFELEIKDEHILNITFKPTNECISKIRNIEPFGNKFVADLRLITIKGIHTCKSEADQEIGRFYISGAFEYCSITHQPNFLEFGEVKMNTKTTKDICILNQSKLSTAKLEFVKINGFEVFPEKFTLFPSRSKRISITIKPSSFQMTRNIVFKIRNYNNSDILKFCDDKSDENVLLYKIAVNVNVIYCVRPKVIKVESLKILMEQNPKYTYIGKELKRHKKCKEIAVNFLKIAKVSHVKKVVDIIDTGKGNCDHSTSHQSNINFCKKLESTLDIYDLINVILEPPITVFGRVGYMTHGSKSITVKNKTSINVNIKFLKNEFVLYTENMLPTFNLYLNSCTETIITIFCLGFNRGYQTRKFEFIVDNKYFNYYQYTLEVGTPMLMITEKSLKFGMVTTDDFIISVPARIYNNFNMSIDFNWDKSQDDLPYEIIPTCGTIPKNNCRICDILYLSKPSKTKIHEVNLISEHKSPRTIPVELTIMTRKISVKFLQQAVVFKDIGLNLKAVQEVKLENSSREIAFFHVIEPLIPGLTVKPSSGLIGSKMIISIKITVKIPCLLEFAFEICFKINNKQNLILPVSGNIVEPKLIIQPKIIYLNRIPSNMITYVPINFHNTSQIQTEVEVVDVKIKTFNVYVANGLEKEIIKHFYLNGGESKIVYIKIYDTFRREFDMYIPFKINGIFGPPNEDPLSIEIKYYINKNMQFYENNPKIKLLNLQKDISYTRISGVISLPWIEFSTDKFEINFIDGKNNCIEFTMTNVSKCYIYVTIIMDTLFPNFTLGLACEELEKSTGSDTDIKFELGSGEMESFILIFHPKEHGRFVSNAILYLDKQMTMPYYNLTFIGNKQTPVMIPSIFLLILPPCLVNNELSRTMTIKLDEISALNSFDCVIKEEPSVDIRITDHKIIQELEKFYTILTVKITVCSKITYARTLMVQFTHVSGASCEVEVSFCFTHCPLTLHSSFLVESYKNPYPYYPLNTQTELYAYLEVCLSFLEKWMYQQGFRRDLYPIIPDTFLSLPSSASTRHNATKGKSINTSYLHFIRRIAGPLSKHINKELAVHTDDSYKQIKEILDTYKEIVNILRSRGANLWTLQAKFLLNYEQFVIYTDHVSHKRNVDIQLHKELITNSDLFNRLNKQSWLDFILQTYKVFVMNSCFFDCVCESTQPRDIIKVITEWYNENIRLQYYELHRKQKTVKLITNITSDLSDGVAIACSILNYCPFLQKHFSLFVEVQDNNQEGDIINNGCLIIEAMNFLRLNFPLISKDLLQPNFVQMLCLSIHLYVILPMFKPKDVIHFNPPLLGSSTRQLTINSNQEPLTCTSIVFNNSKNSFIVEKTASVDNGKKINVTVKFLGNFVEPESAILLVHGYNKMRIFDTYIIFNLVGQIKSHSPLKKCKVTGPIYRPSKVDVQLASPFSISALFQLSITDTEPTIPVKFEDGCKPPFYIRRLNLIDDEIYLPAVTKESSSEDQEYKLHLQIVCLSTRTTSSWIWFRSYIGEFYIKVTTQTRWDLAVDILQVSLKSWPMEPCSCGEACECYRSALVMLPHRNELMISSLRHALLERATNPMMNIFDQLIETTTGKIILKMLLAEGGTDMTEIEHILRDETTYLINSRSLLSRMDRVTMQLHFAGSTPVVFTVPAHDASEKHFITLSSKCGMDIRTYEIIFIPMVSYAETDSNDC